MRRRTLVLVVVLTACSHGEQRAAPAPASSSSAPPVASVVAAPAPGPAVTLIESGAAPRRRLRYLFKPGQVDRVSVTSATAIDLSVGGKPMPKPTMPEVGMQGTLRVLSVLPDGSARRELRIDDVKLVMPPGSPALPAAVQQSLAKIKGLGGRDTVRSDGIVTSMELDTRHVDDPQLAQLLTALQGALGQMSAPFPAEEVGVGARWQVATNITQQGMPLSQTATYTLDKLEGDGGALGLDIVQHADKGRVSLPNLPPGVDTTLLGMSSKGDGAVEFDVHRSVPRGHIAVDTTVDVRIAAAGQTNDTHMVMKLATRFEPASAKE